MIRLDTGSLADLWRDNKEPEFLAIAYALKMAVRKLKRQVDTSALYADIDNLQEEAVDTLAAELSVRGYDQGMPLVVKRSAVKSAMLYWTYAGTAKSIRTLIQGLYGDAQLEEWYSYDGEPYHFRVGIDITDQQQTVPMFTTEEMRDFLKGVQRVSAWLDDVSFVIRPVLKVKQSSALYTCNPAHCGVPNCGAVPLPSTEGYTADGSLFAGNVADGLTANPDLTGTIPYASSAGYSQTGALISSASGSTLTSDPGASGGEKTGTWPQDKANGTVLTGNGLAVISSTVSRTSQAAEAGAVYAGQYPDDNT